MRFLQWYHAFSGHVVKACCIKRMSRGINAFCGAKRMVGAVGRALFRLRRPYAGGFTLFRPGSITITPAPGCPARWMCRALERFRGTGWMYRFFYITRITEVFACGVHVTVRQFFTAICISLIDPFLIPYKYSQECNEVSRSPFSNVGWPVIWCHFQTCPCQIRHSQSHVTRIPAFRMASAIFSIISG